ncbi:MAG: hypothetical protein H6729_08285 [Deltaproteobacteria bacterium]|nr:hypothetical protein [Deltaproteobacteria bacterium]
MTDAREPAVGSGADHTPGVVRPFESSALYAKLFFADVVPAADDEARRSANAQALLFEEAIPAFHRWIQDGPLLSDDEFAVDVANYAHLHNGPGVFLVTAKSHVGLDATGGAPGLRYARKRGLTGSPRARISAVLSRLFAFAERFQTDPGFAAAVGHRGVRMDRLEFGIIDRLRAPCEQITLEVVAPPLSAILRSLTGQTLELAIEPDGRRPFSVCAQWHEPVPLATLQRRLNDVASRDDEEAPWAPT